MIAMGRPVLAGVLLAGLAAATAGAGGSTAAAQEPESAYRAFGWISYRALAKFADRAFVVRVAGMQPAQPLAIQPHPAPPAPPLSVATPPLGEVLTGFQCAKLTLAEGAADRRIEGFLASETDRQRLHRELAGRADDVAVAVAVRPWPECEVLITFDPELRTARGLSVTVDAPQAVLREGGKLVVDITTPDFPSYLYVTYLQASGDAVHLRQPAVLGRAVPPHTRLRIGGGEPDQPELRAGPPFGAEMIVAMATASPLFDEDRPAVELQRDYLTAYRAALLARSAAGNPRRLAAAAVAMLTTAPR
jgi:hypothetical protein